MKQLTINYLLSVIVLGIAIFIRVESSSILTKIISYTSIGLVIFTIIATTYIYLSTKSSSTKKKSK